MNLRSSFFNRVVLASSSPYRRELLAKLGISFETASPNIDETPLEGESPAHISLRLAEEKARALQKLYPAHLIIGSDQVASLDGVIFEKPCTRERAIQQLRTASGKAVEFLTGVCVLDSAIGKAITDMDKTIVHYRPLNNREIELYVDKERPFDCAGALKSEGLGIALVERLETGDPNALIGLPLIRLVGLFEKFDLNILE